MMLLTEQDIDAICGWVQGGAKLYIGNDPTERRKIKIVRGSFGMFIARFVCTEQDVNALRFRLKGTQAQFTERA
jgi:hypothetical protein